MLACQHKLSPRAFRAAPRNSSPELWIRVMSESHTAKHVAWESAWTTTGERSGNEIFERYKRDINLVEFALERGFELKREKSTRRAKVLKHTGGDRILVSQSAHDGHWVYHSLGGDERDSGTIVDFLLQRDARGDMRAVHAACREHLGQPRNDRPEHRVEAGDITFQRELVIERFVRANLAHNSLYLNERGIRPETLGDARFRETWRVDYRGNVLFPHKDAEGVCGYEIKNRDFTSFAKHARKTVWRSGALEGDDRMIVTESAVEALSHFQLHQTTTARYMSVGGAWSPAGLEQLQASTRRLPEHAVVVLAFNNDDGGKQLADRLQPRIEAEGRTVTRHVPPTLGSDWNDLLKVRERSYIAGLQPKKARSAEREVELGR